MCIYRIGGACFSLLKVTCRTGAFHCKCIAPGTSALNWFFVNCNISSRSQLMLFLGLRYSLQMYSSTCLYVLLVCFTIDFMNTPIYQMYQLSVSIAINIYHSPEALKHLMDVFEHSFSSKQTSRRPS